MQRVILSGNLGNDPELRTTNDGKPVTSFGLAVNETYQSKKKTTWFRVSCFGAVAENAVKYLKKGNKILVEGRLDSGEDGNPKIFVKKDGKQSSAYDVIANNIEFLIVNFTEEKMEM